jgi:peroxiredoxin
MKVQNQLNLVSKSKINDYNYSHFSANFYNFLKFTAPECGEWLPDFHLFNLDGQSVRLSDFTGKKVIIETGSLTDPMYISKITEMNRLQDHFPNAVFIVLYVREAYPGANIPHHKSLFQKMKHAKKLKTVHNEKRLIFVDNLEGDAHKFFGYMPNACILINEERKIVYRCNYMIPKNIQVLLSGLLLSVRDSPYEGLAIPELPNIITVAETLSNSGVRSILDFTISFPNFIAQRLRLKRYLKYH